MQILSGGAACGKTTDVINRIRSELSSSDLRRIWVILPDRRQVHSFRRDLMKHGSILGVSTGLFYEFGIEILLKSDLYYMETSDLLFHRLLQDVIKEFSQLGKLGEFEAIKEMPGFIQLVQEKFNALAQVGYDKSNTDPFEPQVEVILALYQAIKHRLERQQWMSTQQIVSMALSAVQSRPDTVTGLDLVVLDGFDHFSPPQIQLLGRLEKLGIRVLVTLPGNDPGGRVIYQRAQKSLQQFQKLIPDVEIISSGEQPYLPPSILGLVNNFYVEKPQKIELNSDVRLLTAFSPLQEVREGLRHLKKLVIEKGESLGNCAILIPDEIHYAPLLQSIAEEYCIPIHFGWGEVLMQEPRLQQIIDVLRTWQQDFPRRLFLDVIRSPFLDLSGYGFKSGDAAILERVSRYGPVVSGFENWMKVLHRLASKNEVRRSPIENGEDDDIFNLPNPETCQRLIESLHKLANHLRPPAGQHGVRFWVEWFWKLLEDIGWLSQVPSSQKNPWFEKFTQDLRDMCVADQESDTWQMDFNQFVNALEMDFQINRYQERPDEMKVQVLRMGDVRGLRFEHVVILGLAEGVFPKVQREDPFLPEEFRLQAGLESQVEQYQLGIFYQAMTRANQTLMVTRPYMSDKGEALEASPYWNALSACLEKEQIEIVRSTTKRELEEAASLEELFFWSQLFDIPVKFDEDHLARALRELEPRKIVLYARQSKHVAGPFEGELGELTAGLRKFNRADTHWSVSRLETYKSCPLRFWAQYGLSLVEQRIPALGLESFQMGSILHQILEEVYQAVDDPANVELLLQQLPAVAKRIFEEAPEKYQFEPTVYWKTQQDEWLLLLIAAIQGLASDDWIPLAFEQKFGLDDNPALRIVLQDARSISLHGVIDRIDGDGHGNLRVIDYKTGSSHLDKEDLLRGTRLQLPLYSLAAMQVFERGAVTEGFYWALNAKKAGSLKLSKFQTDDFEGPDGAIQVAKQHLEQIIHGLQQADFRPQVPVGGCPQYCGARLWCWRYRPGR